jgi:flagella basal body P-ring formation protein FlgA
MTSDVINPGRTTVGVRCDKGAKWSIFTSAIVKIFDQVFILTQPIQLGEMLSPQHLTLEKRDVSNLRGDFVTRIEQLENKKSTRYLPKGSIISLKYFVEPFLVKRGERVTISAIKSTFNIDMKGIAMTDGIKDQRISVKNESSGRMINATVIEAGRVSVQ